MATQATRVRKVKKVWSVHKVHLAQLAHGVLLAYKVKTDRRGNKDQLDLKVTLDHRVLLEKKERKVTWEREASRVIWDFQEKLETQVKKVNQATRGRKGRKVQLPPLFPPPFPPLLPPQLPPLLHQDNVEVQDGGELYFSI